MDLPVFASTPEKFSLAGWHAWGPRLSTVSAWQRWAIDGSYEETDSQPALAGLKPMQRRRLQPFGRMALEALIGLGPNAGQPIVFASRYGEVGRSLVLLEELAQTAAISPQGFSVAVHNAVPGIYTIECGALAPVSAIAAGADSFAAGIFEACALLAEGTPEVWLCVCEEPLPGIYACFADEPQATYAFALALRPGDEFSFGRINAQVAVDEPPALVFLRALLRRESTTIPTTSSAWYVECGAGQA
jgi:hypothetical protein